MFRAMLFTQWKWIRIVLLVIAIITFAIPVFSVGSFSDAAQSRWQLSGMLSAMQAVGFLYAVVSMFVGLIIAAGAWSFDLKLRHVYALSLPIPRWHYVLLRYAAGTVLLLIPSLALWIGALLATSSAQIPNGLHAYPTALAIRFLLASFLIYSIMFAASALPKRISIGVGVAIGVVFLTMSSVDYLTGKAVLIPGFLEWAVRWPGFMEVMAARWMLIDV